MRFFNTAGPCVAGQHYMIDPLSRLDLPDVEAMIDQQRYFVLLHVPRQTGKTSCLLALDDTRLIDMVEAGRARWNIENENNTLKTRG